MSDRRVTLTLKLQPGPDDDLILWWQSTTSGKRQQLLKHILRGYVAGVAGAETEQQQLKRISTDMASLHLSLAALSVRLNQLLLAQAPPEEAPLSAPEHLSGEAVKRREKRIARSPW